MNRNVRDTIKLIVSTITKNRIKTTIKALFHLSPQQFNLWCDSEDDVVTLVCNNGFGTLKAGFTQSIKYIIGIG